MPHTRLFHANEEEEPEKKEVSELRSELWEKEMKLTDIRLEALNSAHQLDQLRETMHNMQVRSLAGAEERAAGALGPVPTLRPRRVCSPAAGGGPAEGGERPAEGSPGPLVRLHSRAGPRIVGSSIPSPLPGPCAHPFLQPQPHRHRYLFGRRTFPGGEKKRVWLTGTAFHSLRWHRSRVTEVNVPQPRRPRCRETWRVVLVLQP